MTSLSVSEAMVTWCYLFEKGSCARHQQHLLLRLRYFIQSSLVTLICISNIECSLDLHSSVNLLLELDITLILHEGGVPRHIILMVRQLRIELAMCSTVERH